MKIVEGTNPNDFHYHFNRVSGSVKVEKHTVIKKRYLISINYAKYEKIIIYLLYFVAYSL